MEFFNSYTIFLVIAFLARASAADFFSEALLGLKSEIIDSSNNLHDWEQKQKQNQNPPCSWTGVTCNANSSMIIGLDLSDKNLYGRISGKHISVFKDLLSLNLSQNSFSGELPVEVFTLSNLTTLDISRNNFSSEFPSGISSLKNLVVLDAFSNSFTGSLPEELPELNFLKVLNLAGSYFDGPIPSSYGSFKSLEYLHLAGNLLDGAIPPELGMLKTMSHMEIGYNFYHGYVPWQIGNMAELQYLDIAGANLSGPIPEHFCNLSKLQSLFLFRNQLAGTIPWCYGNMVSLLSLDLSDNFISGTIPQSFANLTNIRLLSLMYNDMTGYVPEEIADLPYLDTLLIWNNYFTGSLPRKLGANGNLRYVDVSTNGFTGGIPPDICAGGVLAKLILFSNNFTGELSPALTNCSSLVRLRLEDNLFSGGISLKFSLLQDITYMDLSRNRFTDGVPVHVWQASKLQYFNVSGNQYLGGVIPSKLWSMPQLENFSAASCGISGSLPEFISCKSITVIELDDNNLTGSVPDTVADCKALERMSLANNQLTGDIPTAFASVPALSTLDLSHNEFRGEIPIEFRNASSLVLLNVSFNDVSGEIPAGSIFRMMDASAFTGNSKLCGAPLQPCPGSVSDPSVAVFWSARKSSKNPTWVMITCVGMALFILISIAGLLYLHRERKRRWKAVSFIGLPQFKPDNILKSVTNSTEASPACKTVLPTGKIVSVKKIEWDVKRRTGMEEFITQIGNARHKNLIRLLGLCCDDHVAFLLYDYLPNGSLDEKMGTKEDSTLGTWSAKYKVVIGIARGLCYLHHDCHPAIPHGNMKASSVLFDEDMEPQLAEFGLKTLVQVNGRIFKSGAVSGTGEIDAMMKDELSGDVYAFGEVLLEILSNGRLSNAGGRLQKKPRDVILKEICEENEVGSTGAIKEEINFVLEVALLCTRYRPSDRPSMNDALKLLSGLKHQMYVDQKPTRDIPVSL